VTRSPVLLAAAVLAGCAGSAGTQSALTPAPTQSGAAVLAAVTSAAESTTSARRAGSHRSCLTMQCIYVTNRGNDDYFAVTVYPEDANGNARALQKIYGSRTGLQTPVGIAVDAERRIYVVNNGAGIGQGSVTIYANAATGNVAPIRTIAGSNTGLDNPSGVALDNRGRIYVTDLNSNDSPTKAADAGNVLVYAAAANGDVAPIQKISAGLNYPSSIARGGSGDLFVVNLGPPSTVSVYAPGNAREFLRTIGGSETGLNQVAAIAVGMRGMAYALNEWGGSQDEGSITVYSRDASGDVAPIRTVSGTNTGLENQTGIALNANGEMFVTNIGGDGVGSTVTIYAAGANGNVKPIRTINGTNTGLFYPFGIAVR